MAEIPAIQAAQRFALHNDARLQSEQQEQARLRLEALRQSNADVRNAAFQNEVAAKQAQLARLRGDNVAADAELARQRAQDIARSDELVRQRRDVVERDALDRQAKTNEVDARARSFLLSRQGLNQPLEPFPPPAPPFDQAFASEAAPRQPEPLGGGEAPAALPAPPERVGPTPLAVLQEERDLRLADRRQAERDASIQQELDLAIARDRIESVPPSPELPRGSIVDVVG